MYAEGIIIKIKCALVKLIFSENSTLSQKHTVLKLLKIFLKFENFANFYKI